MFGKKAREISQLKVDLAKARVDVEQLRSSVVSSSEQINRLVKENELLNRELTIARARLREIQDKSNARTRKCRAKKKAAK